MRQDSLASAIRQIRDLSTRQVDPLHPVEAAFQVSESLSESSAKNLLQLLIEQRFLDCTEADLAQVLAARLNAKVQWSHMPLVPGAEWQEGRGQ